MSLIRSNLSTDGIFVIIILIISKIFAKLIKKIFQNKIEGFWKTCFHYFDDFIRV